MWDLVLDFLIDLLRVFGLVIGLSFVISFFQTFIPFKKFLDKALKKNNILSLIFVIALGFLSPFCSCTIIPVVLILIKNDVPLSLTLAFFTSAALLNITSLIALFAVMPPAFVLLYIGMAALLCVIVYFVFIKSKNLIRQKAVLAESALPDAVLEAAFSDSNRYILAENNAFSDSGEHGLTENNVKAVNGEKNHKHFCHKYLKRGHSGDEHDNRLDIEAEQCKTFKSKLIYAFRRTLDILSDIWIYLLIALIISFVITQVFTEDFLTSLLSKNLVVTNILLSLFGGVLHGEIIALIPVIQLLNNLALPHITIIAFLGTAAAVSIPLSITLSKLIKIKAILIYNFVIIVFYLSASLIFMLF